LTPSIWFVLGFVFMSFFCFFWLHCIEQFLLNFCCACALFRLSVWLFFLLFLLRLLHLLGAWVKLQIGVPACCVLFAPFVSFLLVSVVGFVCAFSLLCCCVVCAACVSVFFVVSLFLFVLRFGLGVLVRLRWVLPVYVHDLCYFACACHMQIFGFLLLLLHMCVCLMRAHKLVSISVLAHALPLAHHVVTHTCFWHVHTLIFPLTCSTLTL